MLIKSWEPGLNRRDKGAWFGVVMVFNSGGGVTRASIRGEKAFAWSNTLRIHWINWGKKNASWKAKEKQSVFIISFVCAKLTFSKYQDFKVHRMNSFEGEQNAISKQTVWQNGLGNGASQQLLNEPCGEIGLSAADDQRDCQSCCFYFTPARMRSHWSAQRKEASRIEWQMGKQNCWSEIEWCNQNSCRITEIG